MGFAEKKVELLKIVADADEETTGKLIEFANELKKKNKKFSQEELEEFNKRRDEYLKNPENVVPMEESLGRLRHKLKK